MLGPRRLGRIWAFGAVAAVACLDFSEGIKIGGTIDTLVGRPPNYPQNPFNPATVWVASATGGDVLFAVEDRVTRIEGGVVGSSGIAAFTRVAGNPAFPHLTPCEPAALGDGRAALQACITSVSSVGTDSSGDVYFTSDNRVRVVYATNGTVNTVGGNGTAGYCLGAVRALDTCMAPTGLTIDGAGTIFIAEPLIHRVRAIVPRTGAITGVAGNGTDCFFGDGGPAIDACLSEPHGVAISINSQLYIADTGNNRVRRIDVSGTISTYAGNGQPGFCHDADFAINACLNKPWGVAISPVGDLAIMDSGNHRIRLVYNNGTISTIAGNGFSCIITTTGPALSTCMSRPTSASFDATGALWYTSDGGLFLLQFGLIRVLADPSKFCGDGSMGTAACLADPLGVSYSSSGTLFIADSSNFRVRSLSPSTGLVTTVAGSGERVCLNDGVPATSACITPYDVAFDGADNLFISTGDDVRVVWADNSTMYKYAGSRSPDCDDGDGVSALRSCATSIRGVAVDCHGNLLMADVGRGQVRIVNASSRLSYLFAGGGGNGTCGDGGPARGACLGSPEDVVAICEPSSGSFISDSANSVIRIVGDGLISTWAGNGSSGYTGDGGPAVKAQLSSPKAIAIDRSFNLIIADTGNLCIVSRDEHDCGVKSLTCPLLSL